MAWIVDADDDLIWGADFSLTSGCPMNGLVTARSALPPKAGQIMVGGNTLMDADEVFRLRHELNTLRPEVDKLRQDNRVLQDGVQQLTSRRYG